MEAKDTLREGRHGDNVTVRGAWRFRLLRLFVAISLPLIFASWRLRVRKKRRSLNRRFPLDVWHSV